MMTTMMRTAEEVVDLEVSEEPRLEVESSNLHVEASTVDYGESELLGGQLWVSSACSFFTNKSEDRHTVLFDNRVLEDCQQNCDKNTPRMVAFAGVFDGHNGPLAAEYCAEGLLPHIISEMDDGFRRQRPRSKNDGSTAVSVVEQGYVSAFHRAEERFVANEQPPTLEDVKGGSQATRLNRTNICSWVCSSLPRRAPPLGGTTAATLALYAQNIGGGEHKYRAMPYAFIANTGDSRTITDDGSGTSVFRQVTHDHRPSSPEEKERLRTFVQKGQVTIRKFPDESILRVLPGCISVSRTIGDATFSKALTCTPESFRVPLLLVQEESRTQRFIIGCDGLFDVMSNKEVGKLAARRQQEGAGGTEVQVIVPPREAATRVMEQCLRNGGYVDDVTIIVFDVTCSLSESVI